MRLPEENNVKEWEILDCNRPAAYSEIAISLKKLHRQEASVEARAHLHSFSSDQLRNEAITPHALVFLAHMRDAKEYYPSNPTG